MAERVYGKFEDADGVHGSSREDIAQMTQEEKVHMMTEWFHAHFEDPAHRVPYESAEGGYIWIWGGPYDADEEIQDQFSDVVDYETIQEAVDEVQSDGLYEWAPKEKPGDYDDQDDEEFEAREIHDEGVEEPLPTWISEQALAETEARQNVISRLDELEELIRPLVTQHGMMGHNRPPEPISVEHPCSREEWLALHEAVQSIRRQTEAVEPNEAKVASASRTLSTIGRGLANWFRVRAEKGVDAAFVACGTALGASAVVNLPKIIESIEHTVQAVSKWLETVPLPF